MRKDSTLAAKAAITVDDLIGLPLLSSPQSIASDFPRWCGEKLDELTFVGTVNLYYNGSIFVRAGDAYLLTFDKLANIGNDSELCFRPLTPKLETKMYLIWKKYQVFSPIAERLLGEIKRKFDVASDLGKSSFL